MLWAAGVTAVAEHEAATAGQVRLRTDVPPGGVGAVRATIGHLVDEEDVRLLALDDDGLDAWREHAEVVRAGARLVVRPPWIPLGETGDDDVVVEIDPGRAWGHGGHPTTRLCLAEVERALLARPGATVLDVGCGSGTLSVAAARLGAARVVACDVDPAAVEVTAENAARNGVADLVDVHLEMEGHDTADLVVANIGAAALVELAPTLLARLAPGGTLVLSGLLDPPPAEVAAAYGPVDHLRTETLEGWTALVLRRGDGPPTGSG